MTSHWRNVPQDHPALAGHFPGDPLIPGVVLLDWAWQAAAASLPAGSHWRGVEQAKFFAPVRGGMRIECVCTEPQAGCVHVQLRHGAQVMMECRFRLATP